MGRMSDLWKNQPASPTAAPHFDFASPVIDDSDDDSGVFDGFDVVGAPFIEVGGERHDTTSLRLVEPPAIECEVVESAPTPRPTPKLHTVPVETSVPGLFTVRFQPVIASLMPGRGFGGELIAFHDPDHAISEQYRKIISEITPQLGGPPRVLLFTGSTSEAGTTSVLLNVAVTLVRDQGARVTVVDANWNRPSIMTRLGLSETPGLRDVLANRSPLHWAMQPTRLKGLQAIAAGRGTGKPNEAGIPPVIDRLRSDADWILIDAPAWANAADSVPLADCCDGMYLVVRQPDADSEAVLALQQDFLESTGRLKGCVLTQR